jgi:hypothetical protein
MHPGRGVPVVLSGTMIPTCRPLKTLLP